MISEKEVARLIAEALPGSSVTVADTTGTGDHFQATVTSALFRGKTLVEQHQMVYAPLKELMAKNIIHALSLKTSTP